MKTISGLFDTHGEASVAVEALEDAGIASDEISVVGPDGDATAPVRPRAPVLAPRLAASAGYSLASVLLPFQALDRSLVPAGSRRRLRAWQPAVSLVAWWDH